MNTPINPPLLQRLHKALIGDDHVYSDAKSELAKATADEIEIRFTVMYDGPTLTFGKMREIADLLGTERIDFPRDHTPGCESCDYGSETTVYIQAKLVPSQIVSELAQGPKSVSERAS